MVDVMTGIPGQKGDKGAIGPKGDPGNKGEKGNSNFELIFLNKPIKTFV